MIYQAIVPDVNMPKYPTIITSVIADNVEDAKKEVEKALSKPGREAYLHAWGNAGKNVRVKEA